MAWFWTDDLARALLEAGVVERDAIQDWLERPVAYAGPDDGTPIDVAKSFLEIPAAAGAA
jgi:hypothetical protein